MKNMREFPRKKAMTVVMTPVLPSFANLEKLGVAVPPETKEPTTRPAPEMTVREPELFANCCTRVMSPRFTARIMATVPRIATQGTAM